MKIRNTQVKKQYNLFLTENPILRYINFSLLYMAQGAPEGITFYAIPAWLAINNKTPMEIASFLAVIGIPWSFKILIAPLMDRFTILSMGRKRPWVIFGQFGLIISFISIGFVPDPLNNLDGLMLAGFFISFFGAFQDVATDGMAVEVIPENEQARANGLMWGSKTIGVSATLVIGTALINSLGFSTAIPFMSVAFAFFILVPILFRERPGEKLMPWTKGKVSEYSKSVQLKSWIKIFKDLFKVIILPSSIFMAIGICFNGMLNGLVDTLLPIYTIQELGWSNTSYSEIYSITTLISGIFGMFAGGALVDFFGEKKMITIYFILTISLLAIIGMSSALWGYNQYIFGFILLATLLATFLSIAFFSSGMKLSYKTIAATQFTLYMAISNSGRAYGAGLVGILKESFSWEQIFLLIAIAPLISMIMIQFINFIKHKQSIQNFSHRSTV
ncbi:MFS transporter [Seonamhaeicola maritimus]|uniref:AmpG family muropeptide MFS transporter n=1 Tax=Seonamhaeicola maritimus TaxID=2591822 RepID=A0A5C7GL27_9FLAO|nr:MFS transporter [Seonamhaeicola maritimus]TXG39186.1 AmpG family muropeptide MFS transporter [Seonamhaeicola maritimus]